MLNEIQFQVDPETATTPELLRAAAALNSGIPEAEIRCVLILKRSIDARQRQVKINLRVRIYVKEDFVEEEISLPDYQAVSYTHLRAHET